MVRGLSRQDRTVLVFRQFRLRQIACILLRFSRKMNMSPTSIDDTTILKKLLTNPPVKKIDLHFPLGLEVTARNLKGVTIKDALDAIHKQFKKKV